MQLRWYQEDAINALINYFVQGNKGNPVIALPTGTGKSVVIAGFIKYAMTTWPNQRFMVLTHVKELVQQNARKLEQMWPMSPQGIYCSGLRRKETGFPVIFGSVGSVAKKASSFGKRDLLIVDECHLISDSDATMYQQIISELREINPALKVIGLSATPWRMKMGLITEGSIFDDICYSLCDMDGFERLLKEGYLCPPVAKVTDTVIDVSNVGIRAGDFSKKALNEAVDISEVTYNCVAEMIEKGADRHSWLVFASSIEHAEHVAETINAFGIDAVAVHSKMKEGERDKLINEFKDGKIKCIVNNGILTTGFDHPPIDLIAMLRPTMSAGLWVQMLGRGTRPYDGFDPKMAIAGFDYRKENCLVLDFAGNTERLGPINDPRVPSKKKKGKGDAPVRICDNCGCYNHASARYCGGEPYRTVSGCGFEFSVAVKIQDHASEKPLVKTREPQIEIYPVDTVVYTTHEKNGKNILKVTYHCGYHSFDEYVCFEHTGFAAKKAATWWNKRELEGGFLTHNVPSTVDAALKRKGSLPWPRQIKVDVNLKYPEIVDYDFK